MEIKGNLKFKTAKITHRKNLAVYLTIYLEDEAGQLFSMRASAFEFDLKACTTTDTDSGAE